MRKIIVSTFVTLDGVMESPEKWSFDFHDEQNMKDALDLVLGAGGLLLGRTTYEGFAEAWPTREDPMGFADKMNTMPKHVVSTTLTDPTWANTSVISGDVISEISRLREREGGDLLMYGSATLMRALMAEDLIDEFRFLLSPVVVSSGRKLFDAPSLSAKLSATGAHVYPGGMVRLEFAPAGR